MCAKSRKSSPKTKAGKTDRPVAADVLQRARDAVGQFQIIVQFEDGEWFGHGLEMPHVFGGGATADACMENTREALAAAVAYLIDADQPIPSPALK